MHIIKNEINIFMISETKIDYSFPISQFTMTGYSILFMFDRTCLVGGILLFVKEDMLMLISRGFFVEMNLRKKYGYFAALKQKPFVRHSTNLMQLMTILFYLGISI